MTFGFEITFLKMYQISEFYFTVTTPPFLAITPKIQSRTWELAFWSASRLFVQIVYVGFKSLRTVSLTLWQADRRPIIFIGHSLGGLLIKEVELFIYSESHKTYPYSVAGLSPCAQ